MTPITPVRVSLYDILYQVTLPIVPILADNTGLSICQSRLGLTLGLQNVLCALLAYNQNHTGDEVIKKLLQRQGIKELRKYTAMNLSSMQAVHAQGGVICDVLFLQNGHVIQSQQYIADMLHISTERSKHLLSLIAHVCLRELAVLVEHSKINGEELSELLDLQLQFLQGKRFDTKANKPVDSKPTHSKPIHSKPIHSKADAKTDDAIKLEAKKTAETDAIHADVNYCLPKFSQVWFGMTGLKMPVAKEALEEPVLEKPVTESDLATSNLATLDLATSNLETSALEHTLLEEPVKNASLTQPDTLIKSASSQLLKKQDDAQKTTSDATAQVEDEASQAHLSLPKGHQTQSAGMSNSNSNSKVNNDNSNNSVPNPANNYAKAIGRGQDKQKEGGLAPLVSFGDMPGIALPQKRWLVQFAQVVDVYLKKNPLKINSTPKIAAASSFRNLTGLGSEATTKEEQNETDIPIDYDSPSRFGKNSAMLVVVMVIGILFALAMLKYKNTQANITDINHLPETHQTDTQDNKRLSQDIAIIRVDESESDAEQKSEQSGKNKTSSDSKKDKQNH